MKKFRNKKILITGGAGGIGKALAKSFVVAGADVCLASRNQLNLETVVNDLKNKIVCPTQKVHFSVVDVTDHEAVNKCAHDLTDFLGGIDILINCAGFSRPGYFQELPQDIWLKHIQVNYLGTVNTCLAFLPFMIDKHSGQIINISSAAGFVGAFGYTAYSASKFAIVGFSESLRQEVKAYNIKVSVVYPPDTQTQMLDEELKHRPHEMNMLSQSVKPLTPEKVAKSILHGIQKNKVTILPGWDNHFFYLINRFSPSLLRLYIDSVIKKHRIK